MSAYDATAEPWYPVPPDQPDWADERPDNDDETEVAE